MDCFVFLFLSFFCLRFRFSTTKGRSRSGRSKGDEEDVDEVNAKVFVWIAYCFFCVLFLEI